MNKRIVVTCDPDPTCLKLTRSLLRSEGILNISFQNGREMLQFIQRRGRPDLAILDINLPRELDGTYKALLQTFRELPIIFLTKRGKEEDETDAFASGGIDFIQKPLNPTTFLARVTKHLRDEEHKTHLHKQKRELERQTLEIQIHQKITIYALTSLCGERDQETGNHILRTQLYVKLLAQLLGINPDPIVDYAPLHDIGKIGIPDRILLKPGKLTPDEFEIMKTHTTIGHKALLGAELTRDHIFPELEVARNIVRHHHERWDGSGYPDRLQGENIPIEARIMAIADVYDALRSRRPYKKAIPHKEATEIITKEKGSHFDPELVRCFQLSENLFQKISQKNEFFLEQNN